MIDKYAIKFSSRREALRELCKYPGNQVLEQDGTYYAPKRTKKRNTKNSLGKTSPQMDPRYHSKKFRN